jgi:CheY-like chemotaxis protein
MDTPSPILNVEDDEAKRYVVSRLLRQAGFVVVEATTGQEAMYVAATQHPALIVLDVKLPDMSGFEVCRRLKAAPATAAIPVVYRSNIYLHPEDKIRGLQSGAVGYLAGDDSQELLATVQAVVHMREAEAALSASEQRFRWLVENVQDYAIFLLDTTGRVTSWNSGAERIKGYQTDLVNV